MAKRFKKIGLLVLLFLAVLPAPGYYHFVHFTSFGPPFVPVFEKFNLSALVDSTVRYYVSSVGPAVLAPGDSLTSVISQIHLAGEAWDRVPASALRVGFGGVTPPETPQTTPGIDIIFDEIPPGLIALGGPTSRAEMAVTDAGAFVPITRSVVILNRDLSGQSSSSEGFFMTVVHELGHALGLQHTLTSSVMSTSITRATTKGAPLADDDIAAISLLYPAAGFAEKTGTIQGRVVLGDQGVNLASVVAVSPQGPAVSALTNPDGTYEIRGIPPANYYVYVHPLPPPVYGEVSPANIVLPRDPTGEPIQAGPYFETQFYPGVKRAEIATSLTVEAGKQKENIDFFIQPRSTQELYAVTTYSFPGNVALPSGHLSADTTRRFLVASGFGLSTGSGPAPGLTASVIGGSAFIPSGGLIPYAPDPRFVQINIEFNPFSGTGGRHVVFSLNGDIYVLPTALQLTKNAPPFIEAISPGFDGSGNPFVAVSGARLSPSTKILFDGAPASLAGVDEAGRLLVRPPDAPGGHQAAVVALNPDGQSSWFLNGANSPVFQYGELPVSAISATPAEVPAGTEMLVTIQGENTNFVPRQVSIGAGSSDVTVRDVLVLDPSLILANVAVAPGTPESSLSLNVLSGLNILSASEALRILPAVPGQISLHTPAYDAATGERAAFRGKTAAIGVSGLPEGIAPSELEFTLNDVPAPVVDVQDGRITFFILTEVRPGPVVARLKVRGIEVPPVLLTVSDAPPDVTGVFDDLGRAVTAENPAHKGQVLQALIRDLAPSSDADRITVSIGGIPHAVMRISASATEPGVRTLVVVLGTDVPPGQQVPLTVFVNGRASRSIFIPVAG